jgi:hypothetical protein
MADIRTTCGNTTVTYPEGCVFVCFPPSNQTGLGGYKWGVRCGAYDYETWGTGREGDDPEPPKNPSVKIQGTLGVCAKLLEKIWKRSVIVPPKFRKIRVKRTFRGTPTPEKVAEALGLELGPKRKR